jgi:hypothetical protein
MTIWGGFAAWIIKDQITVLFKDLKEIFGEGNGNKPNEEQILATTIEDVAGKNPLVVAKKKTEEDATGAATGAATGEMPIEAAAGENENENDNSYGGGRKTKLLHNRAKNATRRLRGGHRRQLTKRDCCY